MTFKLIAGHGNEYTGEYTGEFPVIIGCERDKQHGNDAPIVLDTGDCIDIAIHAVDNGLELNETYTIMGILVNVTHQNSPVYKLFATYIERCNANGQHCPKK